jgi:hypothetical protein
MAHDALGRDSGYVFVGVVDALAAFEPKGKRNRGGEVFRVRGRQLVVGVGHSPMVASRLKRSKNIRACRPGCHRVIPAQRPGSSTSAIADFRSNLGCQGASR